VKFVNQARWKGLDIELAFLVGLGPP
jgi:hypothetical protein